MMLRLLGIMGVLSVDYILGICHSMLGRGWCLGLFRFHGGATMGEVLFYVLIVIGFWLLYTAVTDYLHSRRLEAIKDDGCFIVSEYFAIAVNKSQVKCVSYCNRDLTVIFCDGWKLANVAENFEQPRGMDDTWRQKEYETKREREAKEFMQRFND